MMNLIVKRPLRDAIPSHRGEIRVEAYGKQRGEVYWKQMRYSCRHGHATVTDSERDRVSAHSRKRDEQRQLHVSRPEN